MGERIVHHLDCIHRSGAVPAHFPCPCTEIAALTARAEKAEAERDAAMEAERQRCIRVARGCTDFLGGYSSDAEIAIFHHGVLTVANALSAPPCDYATRVLEAIGTEAGTTEVCPWCNGSGGSGMPDGPPGPDAMEAACQGCGGRGEVTRG